MSVAVELERVREEAMRRGSGAFLLTVSGDGRPHVVAVAVAWQDGSLVMGAGRSSARNATDRPGVTLLWPPVAPRGYSLIVDGDAAVEPSEDGGRVTVRASRAVLHRPGTAEPGSDASAASSCGSDCVPLFRA
jgi:hypothetical protein